RAARRGRRPRARHRIPWSCRRARARRWGLARSSAPWRSPPLIVWSVAAILAPARLWQREDHRNAHVQPSRRDAGGKRHRARASPRPGRAAPLAPPRPPLAVVVDSSARPECPAPTGDAPGEAAVSVDGSGFCDTAALADVGVSTETGALGAIAEGTAFVGAA